MLRAALPLGRRAVAAPGGYRTLVTAPRQPLFARNFATTKPSDPNTKDSIKDPRPALLPGTKSDASDEGLPPGSVQPGVPTPLSSTPLEAAPIVPKDPSITLPVPSKPSSSSIPQPTSPVLKRKPRRFRNFLFSFIILSTIGFGGGVAYSLRSDNFHDFFTEYVPFGEEAVLYFEEREFRKRFPRALNLHRAKDDSPKVEIPQKSGLTWKVSEDEGAGSDLQTKGRHMSALDATVPSSKSAPIPTSPPPASAKPSEKKVKSVEAAKEQSQAKVADKAAPPAPVAAPTTKPSSGGASIKSPEVNEPSVFVPVSRIDPLSINNADEPLVQDLVKILNDIITVVNADNTTGKFTSTMEKAKNELAGVGKRIVSLRSSEHEAAQEQVAKTEEQFEAAARELLRKIEGEMHVQESQFRDEFESERQRIIRAYEERVHTEMEKSNEVSQQKLKNQLLEQAVALKKQFAASVKDRVEEERNGRLAKLSELSSSIDELEKLSGEWNSVIDANLKTQHLQVAVGAVRASLERTDKPRPFIKELAALKEIAADDAVVNSAIASINPVAYQRGIPTSAQLIDRFRRVADEVRKASLLPEDAGIASHAASLVLSKVMFKKQGRAVGDDVESVLTRTETLLEEGNLDDAAREMNTLQGWAKTLSHDWLSEIRRVLEVKQALEVISTEARLQSLKVD